MLHLPSGGDCSYAEIVWHDDLLWIFVSAQVGGQEPGQFWSPAGIDIVKDTIYIADTFNNRIQILRCVEEG